MHGRLKTLFVIQKVGMPVERNNPETTKSATRLNEKLTWETNFKEVHVMTSPYESRFWTKTYNWKTPTTMRYPLTPAYYILRDATVFQPDKAATDFYGAKITFDELYLKVTRLANVLVQNNIKKGTE